MSQGLGSLAVVLHAHLPWVLNHGTQPHGEAWLYEAAAEVYLPLLANLTDLVKHRAKPALTLGLTPVLLEQLADDQFKTGFVRYLNQRVDRARQDRREFDSTNDAHMAELAERWEQFYSRALAEFEGYNRDLPARFAGFARDGHLQLLTSPATHPYLPLLLNDQMIHAQLALGLHTTERIYGAASKGLWLPECAYRPTIPDWKPPVLYDNPRYRQGLERFLPHFGLTHFFIDANTLAEAAAVAAIDGGGFHPVDHHIAHWDLRSGWRQACEPVGVVSTDPPEPPRVFAFARHPRISDSVWSSVTGYPGTGEYLEFHRRHGERGGLRYHKITDKAMALGDKHPYVPEDTFQRLYEHAHDFVRVVRDALREYHDQTGRHGAILASFDAELFGHWWFEGPAFLRDVIFLLSRDPEIKLLTAEEALAFHGADKVMRLPESSWGKHGGHQVWLNDETRWMWEAEYRAEGDFLEQLHALPWRAKPEVAQMLTRAARELVLLQASDWPFVVESKGAVDYGNQRFGLHATRFNRAIDLADQAAAGQTVTELQRTQLREMDAHDAVFPNIDLNWWM